MPNYHGRIDPANFTPFPKNPTICKFMIQLGRYEELGSGVRRVNQYLPHYAPGAGNPVFEDGDMFTVVMPLGAETAEATPQVTPQVTLQVTPQVNRLLNVCAGEQSRAALMATIGLKDRVSFANNYLEPALAEQFIEMTQPDSPNSPTQKYRLTDKGRNWVKNRS